MQQRGDGRMSFLQQVYGAFVQDQITINRSLSVGVGLRYDWQNNFRGRHQFRPAGLGGVPPNEKTVMRAGTGWFYDRAGDGPIRDVLRSREERLFRFLILDPSYRIRPPG